MRQPNISACGVMATLKSLPQFPINHAVCNDRFACAGLEPGQVAFWVHENPFFGKYVNCDVHSFARDAKTHPGSYRFTLSTIHIKR